MQTNPLPEIEASELKAVRDFLTSFREEQRKERTNLARPDATGGVPVRNGIARARLRSIAKTPA